ncbi:MULTISPECIES: hypothetical protein [Methylotenera]|uniref:hypothetical protein n=1 Tax=Methylotenera TaxID=359407 RepID=UPI00036D0D0D|nr:MULTISPECIES: hypothetical protein [Methylotenera]
MLNSAKKLILCANNHSLTAGVWHGTKLQNYAVFNNIDHDYTAFSEYLAQQPNTNIYLIVDAVEEDYRLESLPHTTGRARTEIIERKLNQFNRSSIFRAAHFINRSTDKRKDDNFLFVALSNADSLQGWLDAIQANQSPLVGVYLLPMISQVVVRQMKLMAPHILLCEQLPSGFRQTYLHNGRLRMSRLVPMVDVKPNQLAYFYLVEIEKTRLYLMSQRLISSETPLQMVLPALDNSHHEIAKSISQDQGLECKTVDILAYAKNVRIDSALVRTNPELLHMQLLANGNVPDNLAPAAYSKIHNLNNMRRILQIATAIIVAVGVLLAGFYLWQGKKQKDQLQAINAQTAEQQHLYNVVAQNFPAAPIPSNELKVAAELVQVIKKNSQTPAQLMQILSGACEASPEITLNRVRWVRSATDDIKDEASSDNTAANQSQTSVVNANNDPTNLLQIGFVNADIKGFSGDYRAALNTVSQFVNKLRGNSAVDQVVILQEPVNVSSLANLQGSTTDENTAERPPAAFKLKIVLKNTANVPMNSTPVNGAPIGGGAR